MAFRKFYVVFEGRAPGIYDSWEECKEQIDGFPGANYRAFQDQDEATEALRRYDSGEDMAIYKAMRRRNTAVVNYAAFPEIDLNGIAVDASCPGNPGPVEYRGVRVGTGEQLFCIGPLQGGTNNIGEYLALVHVAALLKKVRRRHYDYIQRLANGHRMVYARRIQYQNQACDDQRGAAPNLGTC